MRGRSGRGGWLSHMLSRARDALFTRRRRHRPVEYGGRHFSVPQPLNAAKLPRVPGIYAIQVRHWWSGLKPIAFGASENLHEEFTTEGHEGFVHWLSHRGAKRGLWISFDVSEDLDGTTRDRESTQLYRRYFPRRDHSVEEHLATHRTHRSPTGRSRHGHERGNGHH